MTIEKSVLLELAIEGVKAQIKEKQAKIENGKRILEDFRSHNFTSRMTKLSYEEVKEKVYSLECELNGLYEYKENIIYSIECDNLEIMG